MSRGDGTDRPADATAGAWAAAAIVLALGALVFGVVAELHASDLGDRVARLEQQARRPQVTTVVTRPSVTSSTVASLRPADPERAEQDIDAAFAAVYDATLPVSERLAYIDDPSGIEDALNRAATGSLAQVTTNLSVEVSRVTFTSSVTATVSYAVKAIGTSAPRLGSARLTGGTWKVSRSTVCADLSAAGAACAS